MADDTTTAPTTETASAETTATVATEVKPDDTGELRDAGKKALDAERDARKAAERERNALKREIEEIRRSSMSESEKAIAEAEAKGRTAATQEYGKRLARSEIRALASDAQADLTGVFDYLDLSRFVGEDGEPNEREIKKFVDSLPKKTTPVPSFDGGSRAPAPAGGDMNALIRRGFGRG